MDKPHKHDLPRWNHLLDMVRNGKSSEKVTSEKRENKRKTAWKGEEHGKEQLSKSEH